MPDSPLILILDDDPDDRELLKDVMATRRPKARFLIHESPSQTVTYFSGGAPEIPDLFLFDLNMPLLTGDELIFSLREDRRLAELPMFVITTSSHPKDKERCLSKGATGFFVKPPNYEMLVKLADQLLIFADSSTAIRQGS